MLTTRCPECRTAFRITQAQVDARGGKVRCGSCAVVFDARESLEEKTEEPVRTGDKAGLSHSPPPVETLISPAQVQAQKAVTKSGAPRGENPASRAGPGWSRNKSDAGPVPARTGPITWITFLLLLIVLAGQIAFHYRGEVALLLPEIKPQLQALCDAFGCNLPLPRRAGLMSIESSDLQAAPESPAVMVLSATLRNRAAFTQSYPSLELTLTDTQDRPLARRVLSPPDYLGRAANTDAAFAANSELPVKVFIEAASLEAAGYRLYLFYP